MAVNPMLVGGIGVGVTAVAVTGGLYAGGVIGGSSENKPGSGNVGPQKAVLAIEDYLSSNTDFKNTSGSYANKWAKDYGRYLVDSSKNPKWWGESYKAFEGAGYAKPKVGKFKTVEKAFDATDDKALNKVCDAAYKAVATTSVKETAANDNEFTEADIWKYCSPAEEKIKSITDAAVSEEFKATNHYGTEETAKKNLVSAKGQSKGNTWFWNLKKEEHKKAENTEKVQTTGDDVQKWCEEAYKKTDADTTNFPKVKVYKWCSLTGQESSTTMGG